MHYNRGNRAHYNSDSQTAQLFGKFVEQNNQAPFEQKNTIPSGLDSRNYSLRLVATKEYSLSRFLAASWILYESLPPSSISFGLGPRSAIYLKAGHSNVTSLNASLKIARSFTIEKQAGPQNAFQAEVQAIPRESYKPPRPQKAGNSRSKDG